MPGEVCDPIGKEWFYVEGDKPRSDAELLGMYLVCRSRNTNLLLDVPPDLRGLIPQIHIDALMTLRDNIDRFGKDICHYLTQEPVAKFPAAHSELCN